MTERLDLDELENLARSHQGEHASARLALSLISRLREANRLLVAVLDLPLNAHVNDVAAVHGQIAEFLEG